MGKRWPEVMAAIEGDIGRPLPEGFADMLKDTTLRRFRTDLCEVPGAKAFVGRFMHLPRCIASSSSLDRLRLCLDVLGLTEVFGDAVFSADMVARGKPHPDIFLLAAERMGLEPKNCVVIEDSASGVRAGISAGMTVIGLCAGSHLRDGHADKLAEADANHVVATWEEVAAIVTGLEADTMPAEACS